MPKTRLEAFTDGVIAILITIMVLELKVPHEGTASALLDTVPILLLYLLSFVFVAIYWNNHHHMFHLVHKVNGRILWANLHLLFWLSLVPFTTEWMGESGFEALPTAVYGVVMLACGVAWLVVQRSIIALQGPGSKLAAAIGSDVKGTASAVLYSTAVPLAFVHPAISCVIYAGVALMWLVPDRRFERMAGE
jgi:uncharacterized membrane protein